MTELLGHFNELQKRAIRTIEGPLLIIAGPGTGKTLTIVHRIAYLIHHGVRPERILALTFTNRAAREMKERAESLLGHIASKIFIGTFHLLGLRIIGDNREDDFVLYNRDEQIQLLKSLMKGSTKKARQMAENISRDKNFLETADTETYSIKEAYHAALQQRKACDFDDLIRIPIEIFEHHEEVRKKYQDRFNHIIVDEYQDINPAQYRLLRLLSQKTGNVCAVGDPDQAIYAFRGADIRNFLSFEQDFQGAEKITLTENYRSTGTILSAANSVIKNNRVRVEKDLVSTRGAGAQVSILSVPDENAEGAAVVQEIEKRIGGTSHYQMMHGRGGSDDSERSFRFSDFAVIFRTNAQAKALEEAFNASGIPYQIIGRKSSAHRKGAEETIAYLQSLILPGTAPKSTRDDAQESKLLGSADLFDPRADVVTLMTLHMAKGLEFPVVFITGCEEGLIPCTLMKDCVDIEEERRLYYVGMTRAQDELCLLSSRRRFLYGQRLSPIPSPFLEEIPGPLMQCAVVPDKVKKQKEQDRQLGLF